MKKVFGLTDIPAIVKEDFIPRLAHYKIFTFSGPLGSGKTTLIKELLKQCGITSAVTSPTFTYVNTYQDAKNKYTFHHFDLYRLNTMEAFIAAGFDEYLLNKPHDWILIEWPEVIDSLLVAQKSNSRFCQIFLKYVPEDLTLRQIEIIP